MIAQAGVKLARLHEIARLLEQARRLGRLVLVFPNSPCLGEGAAELVCLDCGPPVRHLFVCLSRLHIGSLADEASSLAPARGVEAGGSHARPTPLENAPKSPDDPENDQRADGRARGGVGEQTSRQALAFRQPALHAFGKRVALPANLDLGRCRAQRKDGKNEKQQ